MGTVVTSPSSVAHTYVEGTPSREVLFRLPPLQNMQPITTDHTLGGGDVPVLRSDQQQSSSSHLERLNHSSYERPSVRYTTNSGSFSMGMRDGEVSQSNFYITPTISAAMSNSAVETGRNLSSLLDRHGSVENYGPKRLAGEPSMQSSKGMKPGTYDGSGSWSDYLIQFNLIADYFRWTDYDKALQLATHLRGTAQGVLGDLNQEQRTHFTALNSALAARFEPVQQSELYRAKIKSRVRRRAEPIVELAQDIRKLIRLAYPSATADVREQLSKDCFIDALNDHDLEWAVLQGKPRSVEDALKLALEYEAFQKGRHGRYGDVRPFSVQQQDLAPATEGSKAQNGVPVGIRSAASYGGGRKKQCNFCQRTGHVERDRYQKKNLQNNGIRACYYCESTDHLIRDCEARRKDMRSLANDQAGFNLTRPIYGNKGQSAQGSHHSGNAC